MQEIYISTDIEADGPIPGQNSMLSFGSAAFSKSKELVSTFEANLETLEGAEADPKTQNWWSTQPEAWEYCRSNPQEPKVAMTNYLSWIKGLPGKPVFVGYPASFDFMFVYWYLIRFARGICQKAGLTNYHIPIKLWMTRLGRGRYFVIFYPNWR